MPYEDKFRSVRQEGPRPGTEATIVGDKTAEEHFSSEQAKKAEEQQEQIELTLEVPELTLDELRELKASGTPQTAPPERSVDSILNDLEKMIVDEDGVFEDTDDEEYIRLIVGLIREARVSFLKSTKGSV